MLSKLNKAYIRIASNTFTLTQQKDRLDEYCRVNDIRYKTYKENDDGKELHKLVTNLDRDDIVIVAELNVISGNIYDVISVLESIHNKGAKFICINPNFTITSSENDGIYLMLQAISNLNKVKINETFSRSRSRAPFGYKYVGKDRDFEQDPEQQKVIEKIKFYYVERSMNYSQIAKKLNEDGDNKCLNNNKQSQINGKTPKFFPQTIKRTLQDHGLVIINNSKRKLLDDRIKVNKITEGESNKNKIDIDKYISNIKKK